jgi:hypothetical protein
MRKKSTVFRTAVAAVLVAAMGATAVGCSAEPSENQNVGNFIFFVIYKALCDANGGVCPFPLGPTLPPS